MPLGDVLKDLRDRKLPSGLAKSEPILQIGLEMTYSEYLAVSEFLDNLPTTV